jgi:hypothetical protein
MRERRALKKVRETVKKMEDKGMGREKGCAAKDKKEERTNKRQS